VRDLLRQIGRFDLDQSSPPCRFPPPWTVDEQDRTMRRGGENGCQVAGAFAQGVKA